MNIKELTTKAELELAKPIPQAVSKKKSFIQRAIITTLVVSAAYCFYKSAEASNAFDAATDNTSYVSKDDMYSSKNVFTVK